MIEIVLLWAVVLLFVVVLLAVAVAFYQRYRAERHERSASVRGASASRGSANLPVPKPADNPAFPPTDDKTRRAPLPQPETPPSMETETLPWYGYLICTSGALEGQHFIIEPQGFWIGRPTTGSAVVITEKRIPRVEIADKRISKEHLRIIVRDGKVMAIDQKNSVNGTFLGKAGGERITEVQLKRDDVLVLADNAATFLYKV